MKAYELKDEQSKTKELNQGIFKHSWSKDFFSDDDQVPAETTGMNLIDIPTALHSCNTSSPVSNQTCFIN